VADWKSYKKWVDDADLAHEQWIQLVTDGHKVAMGSEAAPKPVNAEAAKLVQSAYEAIRRHSLDEAKLKLDHAKELNSDQPFLWSTYGFYHYQLGEMNTAVQDYRKELASYPKRVGVYADMARAQGFLGQKKEARETLVEWVAAAPDDPAAPAALAAMLLDDGDATGAVAAAESAIARLPEEKKNDEGYQLILGQAQLKAGMKEKGRGTLLAVMKTTQNPMVMNNSSYELAEAGEELAEDETAAKKAIEMMTDESKTWTLDENPLTLMAKSRQLIATWDTLGWILYREGKLDEAEDYLKAAWINVQSDVMAEHVGDVAAARGKKNDALTDYVLGIAASRPGDERKKLGDRADALRKEGAKTPVTDAQNKLQENRKISLGPAKGMNGVAEYRLLLSDGKIVRAEKSGTKDLPGGEDRLKEVKLVGFWPAGSKASLVRNGMLNCHSGVCELVLMP
jgi:tetratricopeptide (TPR) repeat protein